MPSFEVTMLDRTVDWVHDADAYQQEGPMTTFFRSGNRRTTFDSWSTRVLSLRTDTLLIVRRVEAPDAIAHASGSEPAALASPLSG
jgi:hypothetical protein